MPSTLKEPSSPLGTPVSAPNVVDYGREVLWLTPHQAKVKLIMKKVK